MNLDKMKKLLILIIGMFLFIPLVSSFDFDNVKSYDEETRTATINDCDVWVITCLIMGEKIADIQLISEPINYVIDIGNKKQLVAETEFTNFQKDYSNALKEMDFINNKNQKKDNRDFEYRYRTITGTRNIPEYETTCNGECVTTIKKYNPVNVYSEWKTFNELSELPNGNVRVGLFVDVITGDNIEWIPTWFGVKILEFAVWTDSLNVDLTAYYNFENNATDVINGTNNGTINGATNVSGFIGSARSFDGDDWINIGNDTSIHPTDSMAISLWYNATDSNWGKIISTFDGADYFIMMDSDFKLTFLLEGQSIKNAVTSTDGQWHHAVLTWNGSTITAYDNGTSIGTTEHTDPIVYGGGDAALGRRESTTGEYFEGEIDEVAIWWRNLSSSEVTDLYNDHIGITHVPSAQLKVTTSLISPTDNTRTINTSINFISSATIIAGNLSNLTLSVWNPDNSLFGTNFTDFTGGTSNTSNLSISDLVINDSYLYNVEWCGNDSGTGYNCSSASLNRTFDIVGFLINSQTFNNQTTEGNTEEFIINFSTTLPLAPATVNLVYNGTSFNADIETSGNESIATRNITVPNIDVSANLTFLWNILFTDESESNTTLNNQSVLIISIDDCSANTVQLLNLTLVDEETQINITPNVSLTNTTIELALNFYNSEKNLLIVNFSNNFTNLNPVTVCLNLNLTAQSNYLMDAVIRYEATDYAVEYYNLVDFVVTNASIPENLILYDLLDDDSTEFKIIFTDEDFVKVENALIFIERQYVAEDLFKTVELPKTDSNGETVGHFVRNDIVYNIRVVKDGEIIGLFQNIRAFCDDFTIGACSIPLEATSASDFGFAYSEAGGLIYSEFPVYNETTRIMRFDFLTSSGNVETVLMNVTRRDVFGNQSLCTNSITSASGTLLCTVPSIDDTTLVTEVSIDGVTSLISTTPIDTSGLGSIGYVMWFVFSLVIILIVGEHKTGIFIGMLLSYVGALSLGLIERTLFGIGAAGIWMIVITIIGIYKLNKERQE